MSQDKEIELLQRKLKRVQAAKITAEQLLEKKSRELYLAKQLVEDSLVIVKQQSEKDITLLKFKAYVESILLDYHQLLLQNPLSSHLLQGLVNDLQAIEQIKGVHLSILTDELGSKNKIFYAGDVTILNGVKTNYNPLDQKSRLTWYEDGNIVLVFIRGELKQLGYFSFHLDSPLSWQKTIGKQLILFAEMITASHERQALLTKTISEKKRAEHSEQATKNFVAMINHELRTPLNGILGSVDLIKETQLTPFQKKLQKTMTQSGELLRVIINDLLDYSKMSAGMLQINSHAFSPLEIFTTTQNVFSLKAAQNNIDFTFKYLTSLPIQLNGDPDRIKQILVNLISNALKFTAQGTITVSVCWQDNRLSFAVADTGQGIPHDKIASLYSPFTQVDTASNRQFEGTGLGLAICKQLIEIMQGDIELTTSLGEGSCFKVSLPLTISTEAPELTKQPATPFPISTLSVLVAEDSQTNQMLIAAILERLNVTAHIVSNGQDALHFLKNRSVDVILMDCRMPIMDGFETTTQLRAQGYKKPIIALTASTTTLERERCISSGMDEIVNKPYKKADIVEVLNKWGNR
ncbi:ATP-binding protein [Shewanella sp. UCD-KL12]|uniref:ATP-binding protein n=1 Tax=Shewanella sp. UCD-KL12 TaxID=1917163 RepID=UPI000971343A|nr:ATP-binding protein [Shewanella sp. UCD-KL12]